MLAFPEIDRRHQDGGIEQSSVAAPADRVFADRTAGQHFAAHLLAFILQIRRDDQVIDHHSLVALERKTEHTGEFAVHALDAHFPVDDHDGFGSVLKQLLPIGFLHL